MTLAGLLGASRLTLWAGPSDIKNFRGQSVTCDSLVLRVVMQDPRCAQTTINPQTGQRDVDTLRAISSYRPSPDRRIYFGVYATVEQPGMVKVGDRVEVE